MRVFVCVFIFVYTMRVHFTCAYACLGLCCNYITSAYTFIIDAVSLLSGCFVFISLQVGLDPEKMLSLEEWRDRFRQKEPENESPRVRKLYVLMMSFNYYYFYYLHVA